MLSLRMIPLLDQPSLPLDTCRRRTLDDTDVRDPARTGGAAISLLQVRATVSRPPIRALAGIESADVPTPFRRRRLLSGRTSVSASADGGGLEAECHVAPGEDCGHGSTETAGGLPLCNPIMPDIAGLVDALGCGWDAFVQRDMAKLACLTRRACEFRPSCGRQVGVHIFVDGAFYKGRDRHRGGWAAVIVGEWSDGHHTWFTAEGFACGPLIDFTSRPVQAEYSSYDAEAAAILVVLAWQLAARFSAPVTVHFDAQAVGFAVEGVIAPRSSGEGIGLAGRARCVAQLLEARGQAPSYAWVKGHAGVLWNEIADRIAKASAIEATPPSQLPLAFWNFITSSALPWAWLTADRSGAFPDLETFETGCVRGP